MLVRNLVRIQVCKENVVNKVNSVDGLFKLKWFRIKKIFIFVWFLIMNRKTDTSLNGKRVCEEFILNRHQTFNEEKFGKFVK